MKYASVNWPPTAGAYIDTRLTYNLVGLPMCKIDEVPYTIGAAYAKQFAANTTYSSYIEVANGNVTNGKFKLQGQILYRSPETSCPRGNGSWTWCTWPDNTYFIIRFPSGTSANVPGTTSWNYNGEVPNAPSNVGVTNPMASSLRVNFTDNATDETNILIERKQTHTGAYTLLGGFGVLANTGTWYWTNTSLAKSTTYCYRLRAVNNAGYSAYSNEACGATLAQ